MRRRRRPPGAATAALLIAAACGHGSTQSTTHPADAPPRLVIPAPASGGVLSLYEGYDAVGVHQVHAQVGWSSTYVKLEEPADDLAVLDETRWAVAHGQSGRVFVHGASEPELIFEMDPAPLAIAAGDLDADGAIDVVVASDGPRPLLHLLRGRTDGFHTPRLVPLDPKGREHPALALVDLDAEGSLDVIAGLSSGPRDAPIPDHLRVFRNTAHGALTDEWMARVPAPTHVATGDFDEDGLPDVLVAGPEGAWLQRSAGFGWLESPEKISRGTYTDGELADVDGDGRVDIALLRSDTATVDVRRGVGAGRAAPVQRYDVGKGPISMALIDADGERLIVTANEADRSFTTVRAARTGSRRSGT